MTRAFLPTPATSLRQRMIEDMTLRGFQDKTQRGYIRIVSAFAEFLGRSPETATPEDVRAYQIHLSQKGLPTPATNARIAALRFLFTMTLDRPDLSRRLVRVFQPRKLPSVLSPDEVGALLAATTCLKHRAMLSVAYGAGLRVGEVAALKVGHIDSQRMVIRVERGKGGRYRNAMLSQDLLILLRAWWLEGRSKGVMLPDGWLFPGTDLENPVSTRHLGRIVHEAAKAAGIAKRVSPHTLRHSFATHLLEDGVDIRVIQVLLGHAKLENTALYTQVATRTVRAVTCPFDKVLATMGGPDPNTGQHSKVELSQFGHEPEEVRQVRF
ncbi:MAG: tyrosine-type recombinase/integrase [Hyphomonadaceae bacterium]